MSSILGDAGGLDERSLGDQDLVMLDAFSRRGAYWTTDLALLAGHATARDAYLALERLEERHLVERIVRLDPTSWRRTELGSMVIRALEASYFSEAG